VQHEPIVQVKGLRKSFAIRPVLHDLDLEVSPGERFVLFGSNGSGKTTLVKLLATLARADAGSIRIAGFDSRRQGPRLRRCIGVVTHQPLLYDDLTGYENLLFYGRMYRVPALPERIETVASQVGITRHLPMRVRTLSHGVQKRLSLARALLHNPPVLLLDEPETGLDQEALELLDAMLSSTGEAGRTVLVTTHNLERGLALGDRVGILAGGRIVYQASRGQVDAASLRETFMSYLGAKP